MAESKMMMHQEMITKDEEIGKLRSSLKKVTEENARTKEEIQAMKKAQVCFGAAINADFQIANIKMRAH
jgi:hypothetical protein